MHERTYPHFPYPPDLVSPDDEARVAAQLLLQPHQAPELLSRCSPEEFVCPLPRAIAAATQALRAQRQAPSLLAIERWVADNPDYPSFATDELTSVTDIIVREPLCDSAIRPSVAALRSAEAIRALARQREVARVCASARGRMGQATCAVELLKQIRREVDRLLASWAPPVRAPRLPNVLKR